MLINHIGKEKVFRQVWGWTFSVGSVFGGVVWAESWGLNVKKVWVLFSLGPFPKRPLKVQIIHSKSRNVSLLHALVTSSQWIVGWLLLLVDLGVCYVFVMNMVMFVYLKSYERQPCIRNYVQVCVCVQVC